MMIIASLPSLSPISSPITSSLSPINLPSLNEIVIQQPPTKKIRILRRSKRLINKQQKNDNYNDNDSNMLMIEKTPYCLDICYNISELDMIECVSCEEWYHWLCVGLTPQMVRDIGDDDYKCSSCRENQ